MSTAVLWMLIILGFVAVQVLVQIAAARDLGRRQRVTGGNKWLWVVVILMALPGALAYFAFGRLPDEEPPSA